MISDSENGNQLSSLRDGVPPAELSGKRVLLRLDLNLPMDKNNYIDPNGEWRVIAAIPTIKYLIAQNAKVVILSHLGRPHGKVVESLRLGPVQDKLSELLDVSVSRMPDCIGVDVKNAVEEMSDGEVLMLENLRFYPWEENNDKDFASRLAELGDIFVNDAFSDSHREHASIVGIPSFLPSYAGFLMEKEYESLRYASNPVQPSVAIIGGAKLETKIPVINSLSKIYDHVLVGGLIANEITDTSFDKTIGANIVLPVNINLNDKKPFDIGLNSVEEFSKFICGARSVIWNGPMGKFEEEKFSIGTRGVIEAIKIAYRSGARIIIGGGETIAAVQRFAPEFFDYKDGFNSLADPEHIKPAAGQMYISTGGGAMLEFLSGKDLPGIEILRTCLRSSYLAKNP